LVAEKCGLVFSFASLEEKSGIKVKFASQFLMLTQAQKALGLLKKIFPACLLVFSIFRFHPLISQAGSETKARYHAAVIYGFTKYVYWPHEDLMTEFRICVMSSEQLASQLTDMSKLVKFRNRLPIKVVFCKTPAEVNNCQLLVVDGSDNRDFWSIYTKIRGKGVLMVAENLIDFKKSMISFTEVNGRMRFITNRTKLEESGLIITDKLYELSIVKEGEWKSIFEKFSSLLQSGEKEVKIEKSELSQMLNMYSSMEKEKKMKEEVISQLEDSMKAKIRVFDEKMEEYRKVSEKTEELKKTMDERQGRIDEQNKELSSQSTLITRQQNVISIIALLSAIGIVLLIFTLRSNNQRRKANRILAQQKDEIEKQKQLVDEKNKEILDSINYAKRIQTALMASQKMLRECLPEHFVVFRPKDIVAGDFYWAVPMDGSVMYITADSTGHGVPGAFMSLLNISKLNEAVNQRRIMRPDLVLNYVKSEIIRALNPEGSDEEGKDGMDAVLCKLDAKNLRLEYAAANNSFCIIRRGELLLCKADKMPVGLSYDNNSTFTYNEVALEKGDMIYTYSDGYSDQFGGPRLKKFKQRNLKQLLVSIAGLPLDQQRAKIVSTFDDWKGTREQVDDVLLMGVRI
jgi:serine phosphatase RsbU (regulator of sigma subunit)